METTPLEGSYADWLEETSGETHKWLIQVLRNEFNTKVRHDLVRSGQLGNFSITIIDSDGTSLQRTRFKPQAFGKVERSFLKALSSRPDWSKTRIIIVESKDLMNINGCYIDAIAAYHRLDATFLTEHAMRHIFSNPRDKNRRLLNGIYP
jgi:hypothetical protein